MAAGLSPGRAAAAAAGDVTLRAIPLNIFKDQGAIWSSPARLHENNSDYLVPLGLGVAAAITTDHQAMTDLVSHDTGFNNTNTNASNVL